jgi:hypothetical protein
MLGADTMSEPRFIIDCGTKLQLLAQNRPIMAFRSCGGCISACGIGAWLCTFKSALPLSQNGNFGMFVKSPVDSEPFDSLIFSISSP